MENTPELIGYFGCSGAGCSVATARASVLCDVLPDTLIDRFQLPSGLIETLITDLPQDIFEDTVDKGLDYEYIDL